MVSLHQRNGPPSAAMAETRKAHGCSMDHESRCPDADLVHGKRERPAAIIRRGGLWESRQSYTYPIWCGGFSKLRLLPDILHHTTVAYGPFLMVHHPQSWEHRQDFIPRQWPDAGRRGTFIGIPTQTALANQDAASLQR